MWFRDKGWRGAFLAGAFIALAGAGASGQEPQPPDAGALVETLLGLLGGATEMTGPQLQSAVAEIGGIPFRSDVTLEFLGQDQLHRYLDELVDEEYPQAKADADLKLLASLDLLEPRTPLRELRTRILKENVVGFYDERPGRRRLYAVSEEKRLTPMNQIIMAHELRHALQDQYMDLHSRLPSSVGDFDDRRFALMALVEGDATFVMEKFVAQRLLGGAEVPLDPSSLGMNTPDVPGAPPVLRDTLVWPYLDGRGFVSALSGRGGWKAVREAWDDPPESSEQILHPDKYTSRERPRAVAITWSPKGGRLVYEGVVGEAMIRTLLDGSPSRDAAAAGWGGDSVRVWDVGGRTVALWKSVWDSPVDQREFADALVSRFKAKFALQGFRSGLFVFQGSGRLFAAGRHGDAAVLIAADDSRGLDEALAGLAAP